VSRLRKPGPSTSALPIYVHGLVLRHETARPANHIEFIYEADKTQVFSVISEIASLNDREMCSKRTLSAYFVSSTGQIR